MTFEDDMLAQLTATSALPKTLNAAHLLVLLPKEKILSKDVPHRELLAAVLHRPSQQGGRRPRGRAVSMQESSPADPLAGFHVTVRK